MLRCLGDFGGERYIFYSCFRWRHRVPIFLRVSLTPKSIENIKRSALFVLKYLKSAYFLVVPEDKDEVWESPYGYLFEKDPSAINRRE